MKTKHTQSGYTLLFAVLTASLVLGVAIFILGISKKQFILAVASRESIFSIYNADSAIECAAAAYNAGTLATSSSPSIPCAGATVTGNWGGSGYSINSLVSSVQQTGHINIGFPNGGCAYVVVTDGYDNSGNHGTIIDARGYNVADFASGSVTNCPSTDSTKTSRVVERALRLTYH